MSNFSTGSIPHSGFVRLSNGNVVTSSSLAFIHSNPGSAPPTFSHSSSPARSYLAPVPQQLTAPPTDILTMPNAAEE